MPTPSHPIYDRFEFGVATGRRSGSYNRFVVRLGQTRQSVRILRQALAGLPGRKAPAEQ